MSQARPLEPKAPNDRISPTHWEGQHVRDLTIGKLLARQAEALGDKVYLHDLADDCHYTYAEIDALSDRVANSLSALGIKQHDYVCVMLDNSVSCLLLHFALGKIGAVSVPVSTAQRGPSLAYILQAANVSAVVAESECMQAVLGVLDEAPAVGLLVTRGQGAPALPPAKAHADLDALRDGPEGRPDIDVRFNDPAFVMFTSGTTGPAKGNVFVHATAIMWEQAAPRVWGHGPDDTYYFCVSMAHAAGLFGIAFLMFAVGGRIALAPRFSASNFLDDIRRSDATLTMLLGAMSNFVENTAETADDRDNRLRIMFTGPMPKYPGKLEARFGTLVLQGYGLTDHSSFAKLPLDAPLEKRTAAGQIAEPYDVIVVDDEDFELPTGEIGEILVRSRYPWRSSSGYLARPADSMAARGNDWFHTGDRGYFDDDGYLFFVDRKKDAIRRRGENISAFEVERVVLKHPAVADAAVYPLESDLSEEEVAVSVIAREGQAIDLPDLIRFCIANMPPFMVPRFVHVADELPKTLTQRVEKYKLRTWAADNRAALWDRETLDEFKRIR
jgi:crotonobetaine/carnitine-CoA ligase